MTEPPPEYEAIDYHINTARTALDQRFAVTNDLETAMSHALVAIALELRIVAAAYDTQHITMPGSQTHEPT